MSQSASNVNDITFYVLSMFVQHTLVFIFCISTIQYNTIQQRLFPT